MNKFSLEGRVALITGGATGLGFGIAKCMTDAGARVVVMGSRDESQVREALDELGDNAGYVQFDIRNTDKTKEVVDSIIKDYGQVDILVNNAGNHCKKSIEDMSVEEYEQVLDVHLVGAFALTKALVPHMKERQSGKIIFQASMTSYIGQPLVTGYATAKSGILGLIHVLASELGSFGINVNAIAPGWIDTPMFRKATSNDPVRLNKILGRIPMGKTGEPEDIGLAAVFLASDAAKYINGVCLPVDGGGLIGF